MKTVGEILRKKPDSVVYCVAPSDTVLTAIKLMAEKSVGAVVVVEAGQVAGIITERDYARKIALMERSSSSTPVRDIMTRTVLTVEPGQSNEHCMNLMTEKRLRHLPVLADGKLVGMISIGDLVKDIMSDQESMIRQLESYIRGE